MTGSTRATPELHAITNIKINVPNYVHACTAFWIGVIGVDHLVLDKTSRTF